MRPIKHVLPLLSALVLAGCNTTGSPSIKDKNAFSCEVVDSRVEVTFAHDDTGGGGSNPDYFGVATDDGFIYVNSSSVDADFSNYSPKTSQLTLDINKQKGIVWHDGKPVTQRLFTRPGRYTLLFADNLETEPENTRSLQCEIRVPASSID